MVGPKYYGRTLGGGVGQENSTLPGEGARHSWKIRHIGPERAKPSSKIREALEKK